jgi:nucleoside-diphosphate-sugar epimerase
VASPQRVHGVVMEADQSTASALKDIHKVLVTGASGFIGQHLVAHLHQIGKCVVPVSRAYGVDVTCDTLPLDGVGHVFHLAGKTGVVEAWRSPLDYLDANAFGTARVLDQCRGHCSVTFVSGYVYGSPKRVPIREQDPVDIQNPYALSKLLAERICEFYARFYDVPVVALRLFNVYGPGQSTNFLIPFILEQILDPLQSEVRVQDLEPKRDYVYVSDAVEGIIMAPGAAAGSVFNIGYGTSYTVEEIIERASKAAGIHKPYCSSGQKRRHEIDNTLADTGAFRKAVGWRPKVSIDDGLRLMLESMHR